MGYRLIEKFVWKRVDGKPLYESGLSPDWYSKIYHSRYGAQQCFEAALEDADIWCSWMDHTFELKVVYEVEEK